MKHIVFISFIGFFILSSCATYIGYEAPTPMNTSDTIISRDTVLRVDTFLVNGRTDTIIIRDTVYTTITKTDTITVTKEDTTQNIVKEGCTLFAFTSGPQGGHAYYWPCGSYGRVDLDMKPNVTYNFCISNQKINKKGLTGSQSTIVQLQDCN